MHDIKKSELVQRLIKPNGLRDVTALRAGIKSGYIADRLAGAFSLDYMGSAEFELGSVPHALNNFGLEVGRKNVGTSKIELPVAKDNEAMMATFYILAPTQNIPVAKELIRNEVQTGGKNSPLLEPARIEQSAMDAKDKVGEVQGWFEMDNGFFFFANYDMFDKTAQAWNIKHSLQKPQPV